MTGPNLFDALSTTPNIQFGNVAESGNSKDSSSFDLFSELMSKSHIKELDFSIDKKGSIQDSSNKLKQYEANKSDSSIKTKYKDPVEEKIDSSKDTIKDTEEKIVKSISENLGVSEDEVEELIEEIGIMVLDLLNPQTLAELTGKLKGVEDASLLILDNDFQQLLSDVSDIGNQLMKELDLNQEGLNQLISFMDVLEEPESLDTVENLDDMDTLDLDLSLEKANSNVENMTEVVSATNEPAIENSKEKESVVINTETDSAEETVEIEESVNLDAKQEDESSDFSKQDDGNEVKYEFESAVEEKNSGIKLNNNEHVTIFSEMTNAEVINDVSNITDAATSFISADTVDMINQIVENARVLVETDTTTMEMQLNPENLGKIYMNISSKQGSVNAMFTVTNEAVKEALEAQLVNLRENLNQAGVKVDAVEVTVASHEFERNLDQNHSREEQEGARQEESQKRRNINLSSLNELSGLMTEEEALVAQIMRDNGNSVDLTA